MDKKEPINHRKSIIEAIKQVLVDISVLALSSILIAAMIRYVI